MSKASLRIMTYEEWIATNPDIEQSGLDCEECNGTGQTECWACGQPTKCETCNGDSIVQSAKQLYEEQRKHDEALLKKYNTWLAGQAVVA